MTPYYEDAAAGIVLYHGDCREILPEIDGADACVTDPPWNCGFFREDKKSWGEYIEWLSAALGITDRFPGQCWFLSTKSIPYVSALFAGDDWTPFASIKNFSRMTPRRLPNCWDIAWLRSTDYASNGRNWFQCNTAGMMKERTSHPTPRSLDVMRYVINLHKWPTILDPFMGSGTTLVAAKELGRRAIGIEIEERYCEIAANRLRQGVLFGVDE